jgi:O-antigen ligase
MRGLVTAGLAGISIVVGIGAVVGSLPHSRFDTVLERFNKTEDQRPAIWEDARYSAQRYWPVGAGMGTFDEVFQIDESLENITQRRAGRAHNDYIEIAIEAGAAGFALIGLWTLWTLWTAWAALGRPRRWEALAGATILLAIALQSLVDYPLRNQTMLCLAAFAIALLASGVRSRGEAPAQEGARP